MANTDIFNFSAPDLVNLQKWYKRLPKEFTLAATNVTNSMAFQARLIAIKNIEKNTTTRNKAFVKRSMRVDKAKFGQSLNNIVAVMGSIDISRQGRSTGFEELESGIISRNRRVPVMAARRNQESKMASRAVRLDKMGGVFKPKMFRGKGIRSKQARVARMLMAIRGGAIGNKPFLIPRGLFNSELQKMPPGIWRKGRGKNLILMNPLDKNVDKKTKRIGWNDKAAREVSSDANLRKLWRKQIDFRLKKRR
jgi:hypothetical protein